MSDDPFRIDEAPVPLASWRDDQASPLLQPLERDARRLLRELAEARLAAEERGREGEQHVRSLLLAILDVVDAFERVFRTIHARQDEVDRQTKIWIGNFRTVKRLLDGLLEGEGVTAIQDLGGQFDPRWHRVMETVEDAVRAEGTIVEEVRRGYVRGPDILRKADVVVVRNATE